MLAVGEECGQQRWLQLERESFREGPRRVIQRARKRWSALLIKRKFDLENVKKEISTPTEDADEAEPLSSGSEFEDIPKSRSWDFVTRYRSRAWRPTLRPAPAASEQQQPLYLVASQMQRSMESKQNLDMLSYAVCIVILGATIIAWLLSRSRLVVKKRNVDATVRAARHAAASSPLLRFLFGPIVPVEDMVPVVDRNDRLLCPAARSASLPAGALFRTFVVSCVAPQGSETLLHGFPRFVPDEVAAADAAKGVLRAAGQLVSGLCGKDSNAQIVAEAVVETRTEMIHFLRAHVSKSVESPPQIPDVVNEAILQLSRDSSAVGILRPTTPGVAAPSVPRLGLAPLKKPSKIDKARQITCMLRFKFKASAVKKLHNAQDDEDTRLCFDLLRQVSRSFAVVIDSLCDELRTPVCLFYIVLRALDTVEDEVKVSTEKRAAHLRVFHKYLNAPEDVPADICGEDTPYGSEAEGYRNLLLAFPKVVGVLNSIRPEYKHVIVRATRRMADGMLLFLDKQNNIGTVTEYNDYCFWVAGIVGLGLSDLFVSSGLEPMLASSGPFQAEHAEAVTETVPLLEADNKQAVLAAYAGGAPAPVASATAMSLFLQKTNVIRDYFEDLPDERLWWPSSVWRVWAPEDPALFKTPEGVDTGLGCLNTLVAEALVHFPFCIAYLARLSEPSVLSFCAIPQAMALATLHQVLNNDQVFHVNVKVSRGETCEILTTIESNGLSSFHKLATKYVESMLLRTQQHPNVFLNVRRSLADCASSLAKLAVQIQQQQEALH